MNTLFDYLKSINQTKENIFEDDESYNQFVVNLCLARVQNCFEVIDTLNQMNISDEMHYRFLLELLPKASRYGEGFKKKVDENLEPIMIYHNCSSKKSKEILQILTKDQISQIKKLIPSKEDKQND